MCLVRSPGASPQQEKRSHCPAEACFFSIQKFSIIGPQCMNPRPDPHEHYTKLFLYMGVDLLQTLASLEGSHPIGITLADEHVMHFHSYILPKIMSFDVNFYKKSINLRLKLMEIS